MAYKYLLFLCGLSSFMAAQDRAYFLQDHHNAESLLHIGYRGSTAFLLQAYAFEDSIFSIPYKTPLPPYALTLNFRPDLTSLPDSPSGVPPLHFWPGNMDYQTLDSVEVNGRWHTIYTYYSTDGWVGGRPSQDNFRIWVNGLGVIHSYASYFEHHDMFMLCHSNSSKQKILSAVYCHLAEKNTVPNYLNTSWQKIAELSQTYPYESCLQQLTKFWLEPKSHLQLTCWEAKNENRQIYYKASIRNHSQIPYVFLYTWEMAPAYALVHYTDHTEPWDLISTHYGRHFKRLNTPVYLKPGEEVHFDYVFPAYYGCGSCTKTTYSGFQIRGAPGLMECLFHEGVEHQGLLYRIYPMREIR